MNYSPGLVTNYAALGWLLGSVTQFNFQLLAYSVPGIFLRSP